MYGRTINIVAKYISQSINMEDDIHYLQYQE